MYYNVALTLNRVIIITSSNTGGDVFIFYYAMNFLTDNFLN